MVNLCFRVRDVPLNLRQIPTTPPIAANAPWKPVYPRALRRGIAGFVNRRSRVRFLQPAP